VQVSLWVVVPSVGKNLLVRQTAEKLFLWVKLPVVKNKDTKTFLVKETKHELPRGRSAIVGSMLIYGTLGVSMSLHADFE